VSGSEASEKARASWHGLTVLATRESGVTITPQARASSLTRVETFITETGSEIELRAMAHTKAKKEVYIKGTGIEIYSTATVLRSGQTSLATMEITEQARRKE
jgi:hypothetical protein